MTIVEEATQEGDIDDQEGDLIQNAIGFMEMEAAEIFTPRVNVIGIPLDATKSEIAKTFSDTGFPGCRCMMMISTTLWELCIRRISTTTFTTPTNR